MCPTKLTPINNKEMKIFCDACIAKYCSKCRNLCNVAKTLSEGNILRVGVQAFSGY